MYTTSPYMFFQPDSFYRSEWNFTVDKYMLSQISTLLYIKQGKLGFEKEGHTQKYDESFITLCDIMHLYFDPCLGRLLCHLQAKWTMLIS